MESREFSRALAVVLALALALLAVAPASANGTWDRLPTPGAIASQVAHGR